VRASADTEDEQEATPRGPSPETVAEVSAPAITVSHTLVVPIGLQEPRIGAPAVGVTGGVIRASVGVGRSLLRERNIACAAYVSAAWHVSVVVDDTVVRTRVVVSVKNADWSV
jgi:hypothetical protein